MSCIFMVRFPWDEEDTKCDLLFPNREQAERFASLKYLQFFGGNERNFKRHLQIIELQEFHRPWWWDKTPYYVEFFEGKIETCTPYFDEKMAQETPILHNAVGGFNSLEVFQVKLWVNSEQEARDIAEGYYKGFLAAKGKVSA